jgi:Protein of unknown function (DUF2911)
MKYLFIEIILIAFFSINVAAQDAQTIPPIDKSPMDMSTYPTNYPLLKIQDKTKEPLTARVMYSRPQKNNRVIFGELVEYNAVWRFGANENTEIEFFKDVKINRMLVKKGKYSLFVIPNTDKWTVILNKDLNTWGSFKYDKAKDLLRVDIAVQKATEIAETFYIYFDKTTTGFSLNAGWDDVKITLPINM